MSKKAQIILLTCSEDKVEFRKEKQTTTLRGKQAKSFMGQADAYFMGGWHSVEESYQLAAEDHLKAA